MEFLENHARALYRVLNHGVEYTDCRCLNVNIPGSPPISREVLKGEENFVKWCKAWNGKANCYVGRNPRKPDGTVSRITTYSLDVDPEHPPRTSVSYEDVQRSVLAGRAILQTWPGGYLAESGNGVLVLYRLSSPVCEDLETFKRWLAGWQDEVRKLLSDRFPGQIRCDSIHDNERIIKIPGTFSVKGDPANWRVARFVELPFAPIRSVTWLSAQVTGTSVTDGNGAPTSVTGKSRLLKRGGPLTIERMDHKILTAASCLARLGRERCDAYDSWIKVGLALSELGPVGLHLWETWSKKSDKYVAGVCEAKWTTFTKDPLITVGSLVYWANQDDPRGSRSSPQPADGQYTPESFEDFMADRKPVHWFCQNIIAREAIGFVAGLPKTMKTWLLIDLAIEAARGGGKWLGLFPVEHCKVLYVDQERPRGETQRRFDGLLRAKGLTPSDIKSHITVECGTTTRINLPQSFNAFCDKIKRLAPDIVIIDSFGTFHTKNENNKEEMQEVMEAIKKIRTDFKCTILFVDHETKNVFTDKELKEDPSAFRMHGSVGKSAAAELVLTVRRYDAFSSKVYHTASTQGSIVPSFTVRVQDIEDGKISVTGEA